MTFTPLDDLPMLLDDDAPKHANLKPCQYHGSIYCRVPAERGHQKPLGEWNAQEILVDGNQRAEGHDYYRLGNLEMSDDHRYAAIAEDPHLRPAVEALLPNLPGKADTKAKTKTETKAKTKANNFILEGINLKDVSQGYYTLYCLPLNLHGVDGAPARAILISD